MTNRATLTQTAPDPALTPLRSRWPGVLSVMIVGYMALGRSFAYLGIPPFSFFIGDMYIGAFLILRSSAWFEIAPRRPLFGTRGVMNLVEDYRWVLAIFFVYGFLCVARGYLRQYPLLVALQCFVYHAYGLYLIPALWIGIHRPNWLVGCLRWLSRVQGVYGLIYIGFLSSSNVELPFRHITLFSQPIGGAVAVLALLAMPNIEPKKWIRSGFILANVVVMLGMQVRAEWLGFGVGLMVLTILCAPSRRTILTFVVISGVLMGIAAVTNLKMEAPSGRGGEISARGIFGRVMAAVDAKSAAKYVDNADDVAGTIDWRKEWWHEIWKSVVVKGDNTTFLLGHGYGFPITDLITYVDAEEGVRTPHNIFFYNLVYCGWLGVATSALFQAVLVWGLWRVYRLNGSCFGLVFWVVEIAVALFSNYLETPCGAIPFYTVIGVCLAPTLRQPTAEVALPGSSQTAGASPPTQPSAPPVRRSRPPVETQPVPVPRAVLDDPQWVFEPVTKVSSAAHFATAPSKLRSISLPYDRPHRYEHLPMFDLFRVLAIFGVIWIHAARAVVLPNHHTLFFLGRFAVPFFVISAIYFALHTLWRKPNLSAGGYLRRRVVRLYVPFLVWTAIYMLLRVIEYKFLHGSEKPQLTLSLLWNGGDHHLWFLPFILLVSALMFPLARLTTDPGIAMWVGLLSIAAGLLIGLLPPITMDISGALYGVQCSVDQLPSVCFGIAIACLARVPLAHFKHVSRIPAVAGAIALIACETRLYFIDRCRLLEAIAGVSCVLICLTPTRVRFVKAFEPLGKLVLGIYLAHVLLVGVARHWASKHGLDGNIPFVIILALVAFVVSGIFTYVVSRIRALRWTIA